MPPGTCRAAVLSVAVSSQAAGSVVPTAQTLACSVAGVPVTWSRTCSWLVPVKPSPVSVVVDRVVVVLPTTLTRELRTLPSARSLLRSR